MSDEYTIHLNVETLENGQFIATSGDLPGLVAQGRTVSETVDIARDVAKKLIESYLDHGDPLPDGLRKIDDKIEVDVAFGI